MRRLADCRYAGQGYEVRFDVPAGDLDDNWIEELRRRFHRAHEAEYGHRFDAKIEVVNIRVVGRRPRRAAAVDRAGGGRAAIRQRALTLDRDVVFEVDGKPTTQSTPFYERSKLRAGDRIAGPAVIEQYDTTTVVLPGPRGPVDRYGNLVVDCTTRPKAELGQTGGLATPILMRVIGGAFSSIAKEMAGVLYRMSYSSIIRESEDLGAGIFDADGNVLAESDSTPMFMGAMPKIVKGVISLLGDDIHEGDIILHNDPYLGATHSPDVAIVTPVFFEGELIGFSGASAHLLDIGGAFPGIAVDFVDNWSEGSIYRAVKLADKGVWQTGLWEHILGNTRTADPQPRRHPGDDRRLRAGQPPLRRAAPPLRQGGRARRRAGLALVLRADAAARRSPRCRTASTRPTSAGSTTTASNRGVKLPVQVEVRDRGRRDHDRPHRLERRGADRLQLPIRGARPCRR